MARIDEEERSLWIAALARRIRRLAGAGRPRPRAAPRVEPAPPGRESPPPGAKEAR
jgi:hypothetical protein